MLEAYFVEGIPVVNSMYGDEGIAVGKTGDGENKGTAEAPVWIAEVIVKQGL